MELTVRRGGWCVYRPAVGDFTVLVRFAAREDGRLEATELYVRSPEGVTAGLLSKLPIGRIEAAANWPVYRQELLPQIEAAGAGDVPDPSDAFLAAIAPPLTDEERQWEEDTATLKDPFFADPERLERRRRTLADVRRRGSLAELRKRLAAGKGKRRRPDAFYRAVADAYRVRASASRSPAAEIAEGLGVPVTTVHRWVKEARRRGFLHPGRSGKAG